MPTLKFKTSMKCGGCVAAVTPALDADSAIENWNVDLQNTDRILSIDTTLLASRIVEILKNAGYTAEQLN